MLKIIINNILKCWNLCLMELESQSTSGTLGTLNYYLRSVRGISWLERGRSRVSGKRNLPGARNECNGLLIYWKSGFLKECQASILLNGEELFVVGSLVLPRKKVLNCTSCARGKCLASASAARDMVTRAFLASCVFADRLSTQLAVHFILMNRAAVLSRFWTCQDFERMISRAIIIILFRCPYMAISNANSLESEVTNFKMKNMFP